MAQSKEIAVTDISATIKEWAPALKDFALTDFNQQRFFKSAVLAISESTELMECLKTVDGRASLYNAMKRAFSTGLSLNPQEGKAAIIAYKGKASYQIMKDGAIEILMGSDDIEKLIVETVYENDEFFVTKTNNGDEFSFSPTRRNRGKVDGFFCWILDKKGVSHVKYMTEAECFEYRDKYSTAWIYAKDKESTNWGKSPTGMCKKTVIKRAIDDLYISPKARTLMHAEEANFFEENREVKDITPPKQKPTGANQSETAEKLKQTGKNQDEPETAENNQEPGPGHRF